MDKKSNAISKNYFEQLAWARGEFVCGVDEAGRGCLGGPLVVGAAVLPLQTSYVHLKDSKIMPEREREEAFEWIKKNCFYSYALVDSYTIDTYNIYQATRYAMKKAFLQMIELLPFSHQRIKYLLIDAVPVDLPFPYKHQTLEMHNPIHGESVSSSIAAASIVAKVTRDRLMNRFAPLFPQFEFDQHKGYGTKVHARAIVANGASIIHRASFISNFQPSCGMHERQQTIC